MVEGTIQYRTRHLRIHGQHERIIPIAFCRNSLFDYLPEPALAHPCSASAYLIKSIAWIGIRQTHDLWVAIE